MIAIMRFTKSLLLVSLLALPSLAQADWRSALRTTFAQEDTDLGALYCPLTENTKCLPAGKEITTTRPSICMTYTGSENAPGGASWVTRGEDEACVDAGGLQAFGGYTNYATSSARPDLWPTVAGAPEVSGPDADGWWVYEDAGDGRAKRTVALLAAGSVTNGRYVATLEVRPGTHSQVRPEVVRSGAGAVTYAGGACDALGVITITTPGRYHCFIDVSGADATTALRINFEPIINGTGTVLVRQVQLTRTPHPMPRHDCGPSPCSRAGEVHTVDASGWSTDSFDIRVQYEPGLWPPGGNQVLVRTDAVYVAVQSSGLAILRANGVSAADGVAAVPANSNSRDYRASYDGGVWTLCVDGACSSGPGPAPNPHGVAYLGAADAAAIQPANGHIRLLRVSGGTE